MSILREAHSLALSDPSSLGMLTPEERRHLDILVDNAQGHRGVLAVLITSLVKKVDDPGQDVRRHQAGMEDGYAGRTYDANHITPFMKAVFPRLAMSESGWLTRSLEQPLPYTLDYPAKMKNSDVRDALLQTLHTVEEREGNARTLLRALFVLIVRRFTELQRKVVPLSSRDAVAVQEVVAAVDAHFSSSKASRLPVIAMYSAYELLIQHVGRYAGKALAPLLSHTTADRRTDNVGDIQVLGVDGAFWEAVEVKHLIPITADLVLDAYLKIQDTPVGRYYLLTTAQPATPHQTEVDEAVALCRSEHEGVHRSV